MFKPVNKPELNQISLTGLRAIILLGLLLEAPRTLDEIKEVFVGLNIMEEGNSTDILRIDINTLRAMKCEITRADVKTGYKYKLVSHPYALEISKEEIALIRRAYKKILHTVSIDFILKYDELFAKLASYMNDSEEKEELLGLSIFKSIDKGLIKDLLDDCKKNRTLKLIYINPSSYKENVKEVFAQQLAIMNESLYLYCYDFSKKKSVTLNVSRIKSIISRIIGGNGLDSEKISVKFLLKNSEIIDIEENEKILETTDNGFIVEGQYFNEFYAIQRILSFGADCKVLEPVEFKDKIISKLKSMRSIYDV